VGKDGCQLAAASRRCCCCRRVTLPITINCPAHALHSKLSAAPFKFCPPPKAPLTMRKDGCQFAAWPCCCCCCCLATEQVQRHALRSKLSASVDTVPPPGLITTCPEHPQSDLYSFSTPKPHKNDPARQPHSPWARMAASLLLPPVVAAAAA
jgi:hypothetical protein